MKKWFCSLINDMSVAMLFILAVKISDRNVIYGAIAYLIAFICLDYHTYVAKKLNFTNNPFIKS